MHAGCPCDFDGDLEQAPLFLHSIQMRSMVTNKRVPCGNSMSESHMNARLFPVSSNLIARLCRISTSWIPMVAAVECGIEPRLRRPCHLPLLPRLYGFPIINRN